MKKIIFRKPVFMRDDLEMRRWINKADSYGITLRILRDNDAPSYEQLYCIRNIRTCWSNAAKAGGFLNTGDFLRWLLRHG